MPAVGIAAWVRNSDTGSLAVIVDWAAVTGSGRGEARLAKSSAEPRRLALATGDSLEQAPGLLRHGDVVGVLRGSGVHAPSPLAGLARHGELIVHGGDGKPLRVDLFGAAAVDRGQLTAGAPVDLKDPEVNTRRDLTTRSPRTTRKTPRRRRGLTASGGLRACAVDPGLSSTC